MGSPTDVIYSGGYRHAPVFFEKAKNRTLVGNTPADASRNLHHLLKTTKEIEEMQTAHDAFKIDLVDEEQFRSLLRSKWGALLEDLHPQLKKMPVGKSIRVTMRTTQEASSVLTSLRVALIKWKMNDKFVVVKLKRTPEVVMVGKR